MLHYTVTNSLEKVCPKNGWNSIARETSILHTLCRDLVTQVGRSHTLFHKKPEMGNGKRGIEMKKRAHVIAHAY